MCTCDERRFEQAQEFIIELADKLIPMSAYNMQKLRFSVVQVSFVHFDLFPIWVLVQRTGNDHDQFSRMEWPDKDSFIFYPFWLPKNGKFLIFLSFRS